MRRWLGGILVAALLPAAATLLPAVATAATGGHEPFSWFQLIPVHVPSYVLSAFMIAILLVGLSLAAVGGRKPAEMVIPDPRFTLRNLLELLLGFLVGIAEDIMGHHAKKYLPLLATCFFFILFMNLLGLIPGFVPPTDKMNITVGMAVVVFVSTHVFGVMEHGIAYFKHFLGPVWWLSPLILPIEIVSHLARPMSLSLRLMGNITGDHMVVSIFLGLIPFVVPTIFYGLGVFVCFMQAFIFTVLSMIYLSGAVAHEEEH